MFLTVPDFLTESDVQTLRDVAARGEFIDGKTTGGPAGENIKRNEQLKFTLNPCLRAACKHVFAR